MTKRNPRQERFRAELKRLLKRRVPAARAMKMAWKRVPKNPRKTRSTQHGRVCGVQYAHGLVERWCSRRRGHAGPHSGNINPRRLTQAKAREILHHGRAKGRTLTPAQRGLFGAIASGYRLRDYSNPPPIKLLANGRLVGLIGFRPTRGRKVHRNPSIDIRV